MLIELSYLRNDEWYEDIEVEDWINRWNQSIEEKEYEFH